MGALRRVIPKLPPLDAVALRGKVGPFCSYAVRGYTPQVYIAYNSRSAHPSGFKRPGRCMLLRRQLYGTHDAPRAWFDLVDRGRPPHLGVAPGEHSHLQHWPAQPSGQSCALSPSSNAPAHCTHSSAPWGPRDAISVLLQPTVELGNVKRRSRNAARASAFEPRCSVHSTRFRVTFATGTLTNLHLRTAEGKFFAFLCDPSTTWACVS